MHDLRCAGFGYNPQEWPTHGPRYFARGSRTPLDFTSCAVVASSGNMKRSGFGAQIDAHTAVFRFNEAPTGGLYAPFLPPPLPPLLLVFPAWHLVAILSHLPVDGHRTSLAVYTLVCLETTYRTQPKQQSPRLSTRKEKQGSISPRGGRLLRLQVRRRRGSIQHAAVSEPRPLRLRAEQGATERFVLRSYEWAYKLHIRISTRETSRVHKPLSLTGTLVLRRVCGEQPAGGDLRGASREVVQGAGLGRQVPVPADAGAGGAVCGRPLEEEPRGSALDRGGPRQAVVLQRNGGAGEGPPPHRLRSDHAPRF